MASSTAKLSGLTLELLAVHEMHRFAIRPDSMSLIARHPMRKNQIAQ